jgi:cytidylate kinase
MIIAIDGPAAAGKGTLSRMLAKHFDLARLDTGLIYRAVAKKVLELGEPTSDTNTAKIAQLLVFNDLDKKGLRDESVGTIASEIAVIPEVRNILLHFQRNFAKTHPMVSQVRF